MVHTMSTHAAAEAVPLPGGSSAAGLFTQVRLIGWQAGWLIGWLLTRSIYAGVKRVDLVV
jgi:hypothetical protein